MIGGFTLEKDSETGLFGPQTEHLVEICLNLNHVHHRNTMIGCDFTNPKLANSEVIENSFQ